jgi:hypothetical protein
MKLSASKHEVILAALPDVIQTLNDGGTVTKFHASVLTEVWQKMSKQALERKSEYSFKLSKPQKLAMVLAYELGFFRDTNYLETTTGMLMLDLHKEVA